MIPALPENPSLRERLDHAALRGLRAAEARRCYDAALRIEPSLEGASKVRVRIAQDGTVRSLEMAASNMPPDMNACVLSLFERGTYPAPDDGRIDANVPMTFKAHPAAP